MNNNNNDDDDDDDNICNNYANLSGAVYCGRNANIHRYKGA